MTVQIEVRAETAARLRTVAQALQLSLDEYLTRIAELVLPAELTATPPATADLDPQGQALLAVLARSAERLKDLPVSGETKDTLEMIRRAREGEMWGEELSQNGSVELLTFDAGMVNQVAKHASAVQVNLLPA